MNMAIRGYKRGYNIKVYTVVFFFLTKTFFSPKKNDRVNFDVANVPIGVDMRFEKGFNFGCRDIFPALLMTPSHHFIEN